MQMDRKPNKCDRYGRALVENRHFRYLGLLGRMVRPRQPAQRRDLEAGDAPALLPGNPVPIRLSSRLPSTRPVREIRLHFEKVTLTRQSCSFLRIHFRTARAEPEGRAG